ncbi:MULTISPECIES: aminomethyl-transferring glycine dehydrogenase [unclassified Wenzhouxiangella]|uniref:aminomethyl-transferring glycine dehydrogenase n=1 Tax=unclassified Wenzhouxiangella TaxID=2613841 RepID=UPI000E327A68|nr:MULTISPECIES: aminomethyl-transferring glycine dehydrogenase [unclassified Wenzhouxiangella]RFF28657.1 glycine dehydrogenase (aminomethyl-transferring) [Wenzhouxiangella sp. 15181]RFP70286.1 glycine dehydrogenase (aminomethyl-transferring) [Wenzhouxiangella sp. 15190]
MTDNRNTNTPLHRLESHDDFVARHIGPDPEEVRQMLDTVGSDSLENLVLETMPGSIRSERPLDLPAGDNEERVLERAREMASHNTPTHSMIGLGYHPTLTPPIILRNVLENPGWYTAYTPYQAEISQGRLEGMLNFQQMIMDLTGMELANASLLDESTAAAEAMAMLRRVNRKNKSDVFLVDANCLPQTIDVVINRGRHLGIDVQVRENLTAALSDTDCFGMLTQYPGANGAVEPLGDLVELAHDRGAQVAVAADPMALIMLESPGSAGADVVVGSAQRFGVPMAYGGPHAAFFATREAYRRSVPGRIIGVSRDRHGNPALRMALQTREQHIRREKAMSNICTAQALLAVMAGFYAVWHGPEGLKKIARRIHRQTCILAHGIVEAGYELESEHFFDTVSVRINEPERQALLHRAHQAGVNLRADREGFIGISLNEQTRRHHLSSLLGIFRGNEADDIATLDEQLDTDFQAIPEGLRRQTAYLEHGVFGRYHSETEMLRYLKRLENRDLSLAHAMIPLGSCTMKLNATAEMIPITWPEFAELHPFCPWDQARGYHQLIDELEGMLREITGFDAVSLQPNAGSQGEYAGLLAIKGFHEHNGDHDRNVCLIPSSAHGTNPASAQMTGMDIVVVKCDKQGNIDLDDLAGKIDKHRERLAALMITYPSTHGVFEEDVVSICEQVREAGGLVYLDGANLNALVGWSRVAQYADVCHLNLHKTFCIPHGGGGPGIGPIGVREHLIPFLPGHGSGLLGPEFGTNPPIAGAPWGSAGILPIPWAYIRLMGGEGLRRATEVAILNANYIAKRLESHYDILYTGRNGRIAHECIIDLRPFKDSAGITEEDVAKRMIDYGFHAPTMSWPVPGTLMIEPTESESKAELNRFIQTMIAIRREIERVASGEWDAEDNPLKNAPHTIEELGSDEWDHAYSRQDAGWPVKELRLGKFYAPVGRVDNVFGDRNLVCSCPPMEDWLEAG